MAYLQRSIRIMACTKGTFAFIAYLREDIHIMIYPQTGICIHYIPKGRFAPQDFLHLHLCKVTFASRLNMCAGTIMDKLCIYTLAWDFCIMKFASLKGDMCIIWAFRICILVKSICIENGKSRLA